MIKLTAELTNRLSLEAIADKGEDFTYRPIRPFECEYVHRFVDGEHLLASTISADEVEVEERVPGCHVGDVLIRAGVPMEWFDRNEGDDCRAVLSRLENQGILEADDASWTYLNKFQDLQDNRVPWGVARAESEACLGLGT